MTGRELILYIISNHLEDEEIYKDGKLMGFLTASEAATKMDTGIATIYALIAERRLPSILVDGTLYTPIMSVSEYMSEYDSKNFQRIDFRKFRKE